METLSYKTLFVNKETAQKNWVMVDATDQVLGRLSSRIALVLRGKHKSNYTPHSDCGDYVIIINADKVKLTGKKWTDRLHFRHTGYPGGQRQESPETLYKRNPNNALLNFGLSGSIVTIIIGSTRRGSFICRSCKPYL